jgi:hypothetical protein
MKWRILLDFSCFLLAGNIRSQVVSSNNDLVIDRSNLKYFTCFYRLSNVEYLEVSLVCLESHDEKLAQVAVEPELVQPAQS